MNGLGDPIPLGDEVSEGRLSEARDLPSFNIGTGETLVDSMTTETFDTILGEITCLWNWRLQVSYRNFIVIFYTVHNNKSFIRKPLEIYSSLINRVMDIFRCLADCLHPHDYFTSTFEGSFDR